MRTVNAMAYEVPDALDNDIREQAAQHTLAANPLVGVRGQDVVDSARLLLGQQGELGGDELRRRR